MVHLNAIGSHIGYRAILIQTLRNAHCVAGGKAQFTCCFLLQCRGGKGRLRIAGYRLCFDGFDRKFARLNCKARLLRVRFGLEVHLVELLAQILDQAGIKFLALMFHSGLHRPIFLRAERFDLTFAFHNEAQRNGLHTASGLCAR